MVVGRGSRVLRRVHSAGGRRRLSLRAQLLLGLMLVRVSSASWLPTITVYTEVRSYLLRQINRQLNTALVPLAHAIFLGSSFSFGESTPPGTYGALLAGSNSESTQRDARQRDPGAAGGPRGNSDEDVQCLPLEPTVDALHDGSSWRRRLQVRRAADMAGRLVNGAERQFALGALVIAIPLRSLSIATLGNLFDVDVEVSASRCWRCWGLLGLLGGAASGCGRSSRSNTPRARSPPAISRRRRSANFEPETEVGPTRCLVERDARPDRARLFRATCLRAARLRRFLADASHELRTPITSIRGYSELFRRGAASRPEDLGPALRRIEEEAIRMGVLVEDLLLLARLDEGRPLGASSWT